MAKRLLVGSASGTLWGVIAGAVFMAMFRDLLPAPGEVALLFAIGLVFVYLPFQVAVGLEVLLRRSSQSLAEIVVVTIACGIGLGLAVSYLIARARR